MFQVIDSDGRHYEIKAKYCGLSGDYVYFFDDGERIVLAVFFRPQSVEKVE